MTVVGEERMLSYEGGFEKRGIALYEYGLDRRAPLTNGARSLRVVEVLEAAERGATRGDRAA